jgi:hypothetical protein
VYPATRLIPFCSGEKSMLTSLRRALDDAVLPVVLAVVCAILMPKCRAGEKQLVLREQLNRGYGPELVGFGFSAGNGECVEDSVRVSGPDGPVPAQLSDLQYHSDKRRFVKSARLWIRIGGLEPLRTRNYTVTFDSEAARDPAADLRIVRDEEIATISTGRIGVRLPLGEGDGSREVPGPLQGLRFGDRSWAGGSALTGKGKVTGWSGQLIETGAAFVRGAVTYRMASGNRVTFTATVIAGDNTVRWEMDVQDDQPGMIVRFDMPPVHGAKKAVLPAGYGQWARDRSQALSPPDENFCSLSPDSSLLNIWQEYPSTIMFEGTGDASLQLTSRDPGAWVRPRDPQTYAGLQHWSLPMVGQMWQAWKDKVMPVSYGTTGKGVVSLEANLAGGKRKWWVSSGEPKVGERLDEINRMVLDWPAGSGKKHPHLFLDREDIEDVWDRAAKDPELMRHLRGRFAASALQVLMKPSGERTEKEVHKVVDRLRKQLGKRGNFDVMRYAIATVSLYDALIDSEFVTRKQRRLFRAQMAYLGYLMASPQCWSTERGYGSGNPNMHCSYILSLGVIACALRDHPMSERWAAYATAWMDEWLDDEVGPNGEWLPEGSHYGIVSLEPQLSYAIAARRAGYHDFTDDPRLKKLLLYFAKTHTPPDPQRGGHRVTGAFGRGTSGNRLAIFGLAARMVGEQDPEFARVMQWMWSENGYPYRIGDYRLGGYLPYYVDRRLPMEPAEWDSEIFPRLGTLLRDAFDTDHESYVNVLACVDSKRNLDIWTPGVGSISQWFGRGVPLSTCFTFDTGYKVRHELLREGVRISRNYTPGEEGGPFGHYTETHFGTFAPLPAVDYVRTRIVNTEPDTRDWFPPKLPAYPRVKPATETDLDWTRQVLFLKTPESPDTPHPASGPAYLVVRDTVRGGQPTAWQFWTLSERIGTPGQTAELGTFLAEKPGESMRAARRLPQHQRYTAIGQFGMDVEYFVANPVHTPRHTLRYGGEFRRVPEYQDLLHLQLSDDGAYYVAIYPRPRAENPPTFSTLAEGRVIKVAGSFGTDYAFLSAERATVSAEDVRFSGTAGAVQRRGEITVLSLGAEGRVEQEGGAVEAGFAVALRVGAEKATLTAPADCPGGEVRVDLAGDWKGRGSGGAKVEAVDGRWVAGLPEGGGEVVFTRP